MRVGPAIELEEDSHNNEGNSSTSSLDQDLASPSMIERVVDTKLLTLRGEIETKAAKDNSEMLEFIDKRFNESVAKQTGFVKEFTE